MRPFAGGSLDNAVATMLLIIVAQVLDGSFGPVATFRHRLLDRRDGHYARTLRHGAPLKLHRFALWRSLSELKGDRRASLLVGSGINDDAFLSASLHWSR